MINITRREALGTILGLAGASMISGCATNPVTGKRQLMLMSKEQEIALGKSAHQDIVKAYGTYGDENAILVFIQSEKSDPKNAASLFAQDNGINIQIAEPITVNEMNGYRIAGYRTVDENELVIMSYFIKKENSLFAFHGIASSSDIRNYSEDFTATAYGFDNLTDRTFINVSPKRLEIRDIQKTDSLKNILADFNVPENQQEGLALLNGIELNDSLAAGAKIKIIL